MALILKSLGGSSNIFVLDTRFTSLDVSGDVSVGGNVEGGGRKFGHVTKTSTYTILDSDYFIGVSTASTPEFTITLPDATSSGVGKGKTYMIKDEGRNASAVNITIATTSSQTIDGDVTYILDASGEAIMVYSDGSNWFVT